MRSLGVQKSRLVPCDGAGKRLQPSGLPMARTAALLHPRCACTPAACHSLQAAHPTISRRQLLRTFAAATSSARSTATLREHSTSNASSSSRSNNSSALTPAATIPSSADDAAASTAIVMGSGMCGLAAALALARSFDRVLLLEANTPNESWDASAAEMVQVPGQPRPGVSQYRFMHALLCRGANELEELCPGYLQQLQAKGANMSDYYRDLRFGTPAGPFARVSSPRKPLPIVLASRHLLEQTLRGFVQQHPKVQIMYGTAATGLIFDDDSHRHSSADASRTAGSLNDNRSSSSSRRVVGVKLAGGQSLRGDLVVAAAGRSMKLPAWLQEGGWPAAPVTGVDVNSAYTTWFLHMPKEVQDALPVSGVYHAPSAPDTPAGAFLQRDDNGLWVCAAISFNNKAPKATLESAMSYVKQAVYADEVHALASRATPVSPVRTIAGLNNSWTHYEQVPPPDGLIVMGDAYCNFNPIYAQGMTVAAIEARILGQLLAQRIATQRPANDAATHVTSSSSSTADASDSANAPAAAARRAAVAAAVSGLNAEFYPAAAEVVGAAWGFAAGRDMLYPFAELRGETRSLQWRLMQEYIGAIFKVAAIDAETSEAVGGAMNMMEEPSVLFKPSIVAKVLAHTLLGWPWRSNSWSSSNAD